MATGLVRLCQFTVFRNQTNTGCSSTGLLIAQYVDFYSKLTAGCYITKRKNKKHDEVTITFYAILHFDLLTI